MHGFVWVPPVHPVSAGGRISQRLTAPLVDLYGHFLPRAILAHLAGARVVIVESCAAVALTRTIRRAAPDARIIYSMSDRLDAVGMHPALQRRLLSDAGLFDLVRVPAHAMERDVPGARVAVIRHGIDTRSFDRPSASPYEGGRNAVLVGDMMLDQALLGTLADRFPQVRFHYFGRTTLDIAPRPNLKAWGEQPFERLIPFVQHADVGLALYRPAERLDYLAESSLKNLQYQYCRLPMVTPAFAARGAHHVFPYDPAEPETLMEAFTAALAAGRAAEQPAAIRDWKHVAGEMLRQAGVPS
jgi:2-beta-glucuronyltransferase